MQIVFSRRYPRTDNALASAYKINRLRCILIYQREIKMAESVFSNVRFVT